MRKLFLALVVIGVSVVAARAQDTNALKTQIGIFEAQTGVVIIRGFGQVGSVSTGGANISVRAKESSSVATGRKNYGIAVEIEANQGRGVAIVDFDELDPLLNAMNYLAKITHDVTTLPAFEAGFTTKSGLRVSAFGSKRESGIQLFLQYDNSPRISLTSDQWTQLVNLIGQAKGTLDLSRAAK